MKTERRHKLETNELADSLSHWIDSVKPYTRTFLGLLIAVAVLALAYAFVSRQAAAKAREGWDEYFQALDRFDRDKLNDVVDNFPGTPAAWWSATAIGDMDLINGTQLLFSDKPLARETLHKALSAYESVAAEATESAVQQRATFGVARAHESLGELKEASQAYLSISQKWPGCALAQVSLEREKDLDRADTKQFYDWFATQNPGKSMLNDPGKPGETPQFDLDTLKLPPARSNPANESTPDEGADQPAGESQPPAADQSDADAPQPEGEPAADAPSSEKDASSEQDAAAPQSDKPQPAAKK